MNDLYQILYKNFVENNEAIQIAENEYDIELTELFIQVLELKGIINKAIEIFQRSCPNVRLTPVETTIGCPY